MDDMKSPSVHLPYQWCLHLSRGQSLILAILEVGLKPRHFVDEKSFQVVQYNGLAKAVHSFQDTTVWFDSSALQISGRHEFKFRESLNFLNFFFCNCLDYSTPARIIAFLVFTWL